MLVSSEKRNSELYNTLSEMGLLSTEECQIRNTRIELGSTSIKNCPISYKDVERVGYYNPHFMTDIEDQGKFEVWVNDEYINPAEITWIEGYIHLYGILPRQYPDDTTVKLVFINNITKRYSKVADEPGDYVHTERISLREFPYCDMAHPERCAYYIADGEIRTPEVIRVNDNVMEFRCPYTESIDLIFSSALMGTYKMKANIGMCIDNPYSSMCYHHIMVDNDPTYPIDARFYPYIKVDKDCVVRVFSDRCSVVPMPEISRLMVYPEFLDVSDPYNTDNEYLNNLRPVDDVILGVDSEDLILDKFSRIASYCYRAWEKFPRFCDEQSDFLMCDNYHFGKPTFVKATVHLINGGETNAVISTVPYEGNRDILFYDGMILSTYKVVNLHTTLSGDIVEDFAAGVPTYVLSSEYDPDRLTIIKFNAGEDTMIVNLGEYVDETNLAKLHIKMNRFYRNLLILRGKVNDMKGDQYVRVSTAPPTEKDSYLWFELLVNAVPEIFNDQSFEMIKSFGLDPYNLPEDLKEGMYTLSLEPDAGPENYTELLFTYFKLNKGHRKYLVLQYGDGVDDPRIQVYHDLMHGKLPDNPSLNDTVIENPNMTDTESFSQYDVTKGPPPMDGNEIGDISVTGDDGQYDDLVEDLLGGVGSFDATDFVLDDISYMDMETGKSIGGDTIASWTVEQKRAVITRYITDGDDEDRQAVLSLWNEYLDNMDEATLNIAVYKVLLTDYAYNTAIALRAEDEASPTPMKDVKYVVSEDEPVDKDIGTYWLDIADNATAPIITEAKKHNLTYIYSAVEPDTDEIGAIWINIHGLTLQDYIDDIIGNPISESIYYLPEGFFDGDRASVTFDYGAHGSETELELFRKREDNSLHKIHFGEAFAGEPSDGDVWFEFLDEIDNRVCYSDTESMVLNVNERLVYVQFDHDNITSFLFDDIVMNFKGKLGIKYLSIVADLLNSGVIKQDDVNVFYRRLVTGPDRFDLRLERLYTGRSFVISTAKIDTTDYAVTYSTNIGRMHINYNDPGVPNRERESAYRMVIDYSRRDIAFIGDRMMLFVNGRYIPRTEYEEIAAGKIKLQNFHEIIACVDIFYSIKDVYISRAKKACIQYWAAPDTSVSIQRPDINYDRMVPIHIMDYTMRGYYDVLLTEYIFNGRLMRMLRYLEDHPDERDQWILDFKRKFHAICDTDLSGMHEDASRIVIPGLIDCGFPPYSINAQE